MSPLQTEWPKGSIRSGSVIAGKYRVDGMIGRGAMGLVVRAWHLRLDEPVAIKVLLPEFVENDEALARFEREARAVFKIRSEHVSRVLDVGRIDNKTPFIVMEFLEGQDIASFIDDEAPVPVSVAIDLAVQACAAIAEAHSMGIVHRDLKPENLFLTKRRDGSPCVKVLDFGLSKMLKTEQGARSRALTTNEQVMGTAHYMSPEQWRSTKNVGPSTDIWSMGVILYELISGRSPFLRAELAQTCDAVLREMPRSLTIDRHDVPAMLDQVIRQCIEKKIEDRHASIADLAGALTPFASEPVQALAQRVARSGPRASMISRQDLSWPNGVASQSRPSAPAAAGSRPSVPPSSSRPFSAPPSSSRPFSAPPSSSQPFSSQPSSVSAVPAPLASIDPIPMPRLGLPDPFGGVTTWQEVIDRRPVGRRRLWIVLGLVALVVATLLGAWQTLSR